jgi:hypothetical protein
MHCQRQLIGELSHEAGLKLTATHGGQWIPFSPRDTIDWIGNRLITGVSTTWFSQKDRENDQRDFEKKNDMISLCTREINYHGVPQSMKSVTSGLISKTIEENLKFCSNGSSTKIISPEKMNAIERLWRDWKKRRDATDSTSAFFFLNWRISQSEVWNDHLQQDF